MRPGRRLVRDADRPWPKAGGSGYLIAWPVLTLTGEPGRIRTPVGYELTLGTPGRHRRERLRPSLPRDGGERLRRLGFVLRATSALQGFLILPWAVRSYEDAEILEETWEGSRAMRPREQYVVPVRPAGFLAEASVRLAAAGFRRAAEGEPYLHRSAIERLHLTARDFILLAPLPDAVPTHWARDIAALGLGRIPTIGRDVLEPDVLRVLRDAGVTHATGRAVMHPVAVPLPWAHQAATGDGPEGTGVNTEEGAREP